MTDRLAAQMAFLAEADRLKSVLRATTLADGSRPENSGEHSWHLALYALVLADQAGAGVSVDRVIRMLLIHDLVEIDVGDVPIHSANGTAHGSAEVLARERAAADRIFGLLPSDLRDDLRALWEEFEAAESPDAAVRQVARPGAARDAEPGERRGHLGQLRRDLGAAGAAGRRQGRPGGARALDVGGRARSPLVRGPLTRLHIGRALR